MLFLASNGFIFIEEGMLNIIDILQQIAQYFSSLFSALFLSFRFCLQSILFVSEMNNFMPAIVGACASMVVAIAVVKAIFGR